MNETKKTQTQNNANVGIPGFDKEKLPAEIPFPKPEFRQFFVAS